MTIKEIIDSHHISQAEVCRLIGIQIHTMSQWYVGNRVPPEYVVKLIAYYLDHELGVPASRASAQNNQTK